MIITPASYREIPHHRDLANRIMTTLGLNPDDVTEIRTDETGTEVDVLRVPNHTIRTMTSRPPGSPVDDGPRRSFCGRPRRTATSSLSVVAMKTTVRPTDTCRVTRLG